MLGVDVDRLWKSYEELKDAIFFDGAHWILPSMVEFSSVASTQNPAQNNIAKGFNP